MDARSSLISAIAFALLRCKALFRVMAQSHNTDEARHAAAEIIADQIELAEPRGAPEAAQATAQHAMRTLASQFRERTACHRVSTASVVSTTRGADGASCVMPEG